MYELYAHHRPDHTTGTGKGNGGGNGNGNGNNVPEIDGGALLLALLVIFCFWLLLKRGKNVRT